MMRVDKLELDDTTSAYDYLHLEVGATSPAAPELTKPASYTDVEDDYWTEDDVNPWLADGTRSQSSARGFSIKIVLDYPKVANGH